MGLLLLDQSRLEDAERLLRPASKHGHEKSMPGSYFTGITDGR
ncbi:MAG TPA: hypothetical protein VGJ26_17435 [Pirellulales bacterium]